MTQIEPDTKCNFTCKFCILHHGELGSFKEEIVHSDDKARGGCSRKESVKDDFGKVGFDPMNEIPSKAK